MVIYCDEEVGDFQQTTSNTLRAVHMLKLINSHSRVALRGDDKSRVRGNMFASQHWRNLDELMRLCGEANDGDEGACETSKG